VNMTLTTKKEEGYTALDDAISYYTTQYYTNAYKNDVYYHHAIQCIDASSCTNMRIQSSMKEWTTEDMIESARRFMANTGCSDGDMHTQTYLYTTQMECVVTSCYHSP
jgi:hypothetical protein